MQRNINVGQATPDNASQEACILIQRQVLSDRQTTKSVKTRQAKPDLHLIHTPHPAFGHPLPQGAREKSGGFTLIELLVVVLIIGILAAVAVPQYRLAVEKARASEALTNLRTLVNAETIYKMANGSATSSIDELDISIGQASANQIVTSNFRYTISLRNWGTGFEAIAFRKYNNNSSNYYIYYDGNGNLHCVAQTQEARTICHYLSHGR